MWASNVAERVELDSLFESKWEMSGFVNYIVRIAANSGGRRTMIGVFMFWKRLLFDCVGSSIDGSMPVGLSSLVVDLILADTNRV